MLDGSEYEILRNDHEKFKPLYFSRQGQHQEAFETLYVSIEKILTQYEDEIKKMEKWYSAQEANVEQQRIKV